MNEIILFSSEKFKTSKKCEELAQTKGNEFVKHTNFQLIRIYPHAVNQLSQNYDPIMPWANGCQVGTVFYSERIIVNDHRADLRLGCPLESF